MLQAVGLHFIFLVIAYLGDDEALNIPTSFHATKSTFVFLVEPP